MLKIDGLVRNIEQKDSNVAEVGHLFLWLREVNLKSKHISLVEIGSYFSHMNGRDRGLSFKWIKYFLISLVVASERGGTMYFQPWLFKREEILKAVISTLRRQKVSFDEIKFTESKNYLFNLLIEGLDGCNFIFTEFKDYNLKCFLRKGSGLFELQVVVKMKIKGKITVSDSAEITPTYVFDVAQDPFQ